MAPSPTKRVTRSTKTKQFADLGKSPPRITKRSKKPDAAFRPCRISNAKIQDQSDSHPQRPTQQAKRTTTTGRPAPPSGSRIICPKGIVTRGGAHVIRNTKPGESTLSAPNPDRPADLPQNGHLESEFSPLIRTEAPPLFFQQKPVEELCHDILESPDLRFDQRAIEDLLADALPQTPEQITQCYQDLRSFAWKWAQETFQPAASSSSPPLNLMDLATTHPELMEYINATTASPQHTDWETFLQKKRAPVVYAIVGKAIDLHIFGEELFGASPEEKATLRAIDRKYMDHDGFHRQQTRAITLSSLIPQHPALPRHTLPGLQTLHGQLIALLSPLLPPPSDPNPLHTPLFALLLTATLLALTIRTVPNEITYFTPAPSPGTRYDAETMTALNAADIAVTEGVAGVKEMVKKGKLRYIVGCSGWPGCVAYWPVGAEGEGVGFFGEQDPKKKKKKQETGVQTQLIARADIYLVLEAVVHDTNSHPTNINTDNKQKQRKTLRAEMWARAQCMDSVDTLPPTSSTINTNITNNNHKNRKTLRAAMRVRAQRRETEIERQIEIQKRRRRWGLAAAALVVGGYFWGAGAGGAVKGVLGAGPGEKVKGVLGAGGGEMVSGVLGGQRLEDFAVRQRGVWVEEMRRVVMGIGG